MGDTQTSSSRSLTREVSRMNNGALEYLSQVISWSVPSAKLIVTVMDVLVMGLTFGWATDADEGGCRVRRG